MKSSPGERRRIATAWLFLFPALATIAVFQFFPIASAFALSLWDYFPDSPNNRFVGLDNFASVLRDPGFWAALRSSVLYLLVVPVLVALSLGLALLVEPNVPFMGFFRACYYMPVVTMTVVVAYAWGLIFNSDNGMLNKLLARVGAVDSPVPWLTSESLALWTVMTVTVWKGLGYYMVMFVVGLKTVPKELHEAARIDGAGAVQSFRNVTLPMLWPTITLVSIVSSISALQVFEEIYMMTAGRVGTATLVYEIYATGFDMSRGTIDFGRASAMGAILFALILGFTVVAVRRMQEAYRT